MTGTFVSLFFNKRNPLISLLCITLIIFASSRLSFALTASAALVWVYVLTALAVFATSPILPREGKTLVVGFMASFIASLFLFALWFISPLLVLEMRYLVMLTPLCFLGTFSLEKLQSARIVSVARGTVLEACVFSGVITGFSLIREPLGFMSLTVPGGAQGMIELFNTSDTTGFLPLGIVSTAGGALLLLGYAVALFVAALKRPKETL